MLVPLVVEEPASEAVQRFLGQQTADLLVSEFAAAEAASALSRLVRMKEFNAAHANAALEDLDAWRFASTRPIEVTDGDFRLAHLMVRRFETRLRAADALHLAITRRLGACLFTRDTSLREAAELLDVESVEPEG